MPDAIKPEVVDSVPDKSLPLTKEGKPFRERKHGKIAALPDQVRTEMEHRLAEPGNSLRLVSKWLEDEHAARIGPTSLQRHKRRLDLKLLPVKYATQEARAIVEASGGDNEEINRALTMLVQTKIYEMLVQMNTVIEAFDHVKAANAHSRMWMKTHREKQKEKAGQGAEPQTNDDAALLPEQPNPAALVAVTMLAKNTAAIGHHVIEFEKWDLERDLKLARQIEVAEQKVSKVVDEAGLSPEVEKNIRAALMEIKP